MKTFMKKKEIVEYFKGHALADWVIALSGQWDLFAEFVVKDLFHLQDILAEILDRFSGSINTYQLFIAGDILRVEHLVEDFYKDLKFGKPVLKERTKESYKTDLMDKRILNLLNQDSSLPYLAIAQKLDTTIDVVRYRIKNMLNKGIIIKFFPEISLQKLGYTKYLCNVRLMNISKEKAEKIKKMIQSNVSITYAFADITGLNIVFVCAFKDPEGIDHLLRSLRKEFSDIIEEQNYLIVKEEILFNLFPIGIVKG